MGVESRPGSAPGTENKEKPMPTAAPNRLIHEKSPYLLQHAYNPVDWYPWGPEALERARAENKPILLSVGYSTCHWCHVMEHESFSDDTIAAVMNRHFICIKVDREERPDLDKIYITAVSAMTGSAGWPLNVFLTPEGHPFYGGTYFPPRSHPGGPAWPEVLRTVADHWADPERKRRLMTSGHNVTATLQEHLAWTAGDGRTDRHLPEQALERLRSAYDSANGGFGRAPKFPSPSLLQFLLTQGRQAQDAGPEKPAGRDMALHTLKAMARGGIFDHLGGGFHRYATDAAWHVPHFEKMLYDNAQLLSVYLQAFRLTGDEALARVARRTADYVLGEMRHPQGGFYSAEDADSLPPGASRGAQKKEGAYFTWPLAEIEAALGADSTAFIHHFGLRAEGNAASDPHQEFSGLNILHEVHTLEETAEYFKEAPAAAAARLARSARKLMAVRQARPRPHRDEKILTAWNALMISGLAQAYQSLGENHYLDAARRAADFLLEHLYDSVRRNLFRSWCDGERRVPGMADDYVFLVQAFLDLYASDFQHHWLTKAIAFNDVAVEQFYDAAAGGFYLTRPDHDPDLILRVKEDADSVIPSASAVAALNLLRLARLTGREDLQHMADRTIDSGLGRMKAHPEAAPCMLRARRIQQTPWVQIAVAGDGDHPESRGMIDAVRRAAIDGCAVTWLKDDTQRRQVARDIPFAERAVPIDGHPAAYVCINRSCRDPLRSASDLTDLLEGIEGGRPGA
jgi:uncharacterized protein YyaL (SSP411 family)